MTLQPACPNVELERSSVELKNSLLFTTNDSSTNKLNSTKVIQTLGISFKRKHVKVFKSSTIYLNTDFTIMEDSQNKDDKNLNYFESLIKMYVFNTF